MGTVQAVRWCCGAAFVGASPVVVQGIAGASHASAMCGTAVRLMEELDRIRQRVGPKAWC